MNNFEYLQRYYPYLNDECEYIVQKPKSKNKKFDIHDLAQVTLYQGKNAKVGVKLVQDMLPKVLYFSIIDNYYSYKKFQKTNNFFAGVRACLFF